MSYKFKPEFCKIAVDHLKSGLSISCLGPSLTSEDNPIGVTRSTVYNWVETIPEFKEAVEVGLQHAQKFFEDRLATKLSGKENPELDHKLIDTSCLIFALKTRFHKDYGEKTQVDHTVTAKKLIIEGLDE